MKIGRFPPLLLVLVAISIAAGALAVLQYHTRAESTPVELEATPLALDVRESAAEAALETVTAPEEAIEQTVRTEVATSKQVTEVDPRKLTLQVLDASGAQVADAKLILFRGEEFLAEGTTDAGGLAQFAAREGAGEYLLAVPGWEPARGELELSAGRRIVTLQEGAIIAGTVLVDGALPSEPFDLTWNPRDRKRGVYALPKAVIKALSVVRGKRLVSAARTNADGSFAFRGLASDASGSIQWAAAYFNETGEFEHQRRRVEVPAPQSDLLLRLVRGAELRLRVVDPAGNGLPGAVISVGRFTKTPDGSSSSSEGGLADSDGRFVQGLAPQSFDELSISVSTAQGSGSRTYKFVSPPRLDRVWDLGDLAIQASRPLSVLVLDTQGQPIKDAQAMPWPAPARRPNDRSDAAGRMTIAIAPGDAEFAVEAFGYVSALVAAPAQALEVIATLPRACMLEIEVLGLTGHKHDLAVALEGRSPLFVDQGSEGPQTMKSVGGSWSSSTSDELTTFETEAEKSGRWRIAGLVAGVPMHAALKGGGQTLSEVEIAPLARGEHRKIELHLDEVGKPLRVRVISTEGKVVSAAQVYVLDPENTSTYRGRGVDAQGELELGSLYGDHCTIFVRADGYAPKWTTLRPIPDGAVDIVLGTPHSIEIELVRPDGSLFLDESRVWAGSPGPRYARATSTGPGRFRLDDLPGTEVLLGASGSFGSVSQLHDGSVPFARIVVGGVGTIRGTLRDAPVNQASIWSVAISAPGAARDLTREPLDSDRAGTYRGDVGGLLDGTYEVWLEHRFEDSIDDWSRVGRPTVVILDAEHSFAEVALQPPY